MDLNPYIDRLRNDLAAVAHAGGDEATAIAERLLAPLESTTRLLFLEVLSVAASDITREIAPGSVRVLLRGLDPEFVVALPEAEEAFAGNADVTEVAVDSAPATDGDSTARVNLRLPESLKDRIEDAAAADGMSINAWLVRAAATALSSGNAGQSRGRNRPPVAGQRFTGWVS